MSRLRVLSLIIGLCVTAAAAPSSAAGADFKPPRISAISVSPRVVCSEGGPGGDFRTATFTLSEPARVRAHAIELWLGWYPVGYLTAINRGGLIPAGTTTEVLGHGRVPMEGEAERGFYFARLPVENTGTIGFEAIDAAGNHSGIRWISNVRRQVLPKVWQPGMPDCVQR